MRILGIDPGLRITGYGCLECSISRPTDCPTVVEAGAIVLSREHRVAARLVELERDLNELLERTNPELVAVEKLYAHYKHPRTAIIMGHARGVILLVAARRGARIIELPSTEVKKSITGNGHASKPQVQSAVQNVLRLPEPPRPADVADALAIALCAAVRAESLDRAGA